MTYVTSIPLQDLFKKPGQQQQISTHQGRSLVLRRPPPMMDYGLNFSFTITSGGPTTEPDSAPALAHSYTFSTSNLNRPMRLLLGSYVLFTVAISGSSPAVAQSQICGELLRGGVFNASELKRDSDNYSMLKTEFCDTYNSQSTNSSSGSTVGGASYGGFGGIFSKSQAVANNQQLFKELCTSSDGEFQTNERLRSSAREASKELSTLFVECVKNTKTGFNSYFTAPSYDLFTVHMHYPQHVSSNMEIQSVSFSPNNADISCKPNGVMNATEEKPYKTPNGQDYFSITCTKDPKRTATLTLQVAQAGGPVEGVVPGSDDRLVEIEEQLSKMGAELDSVKNYVKNIKRTETGILTCQGKRVKLGDSWESRASWTVSFNPPFREPPTVSAAVSMIEKYSDDLTDAWAVDVSDVTSQSARVSFRGAHVTSSFSQCAVQWTAVGR